MKSKVKVAYLYEIIEVASKGTFCDFDFGRGYFRLTLKVKVKVRGHLTFIFTFDNHQGTLLPGASPFRKCREIKVG